MLTTPALAASTGAVAGTVTDAATKSPVANECAAAYTAGNSLAGSTLTDSQGHYTLSGLAPGTYRVGFRSCSGGNYAPQFYDNRASLATADSVTVTAGNTTPGIDAALPTGGQITGTVVDATTRAPVANACVAAYDASSFVSSGSTDSSGHYTIAGLGTGEYTVGFQGCGGGNYAPQFYNGKPSPPTADPVPVTAGRTTSGIDAALQPAGSIAGTVTDAATGGPVTSECVNVYDAGNNLVASGITDSSGRYSVTNVAVGSYRVGFRACAGGNFASQFYNGKASLSSADPVTVTAGNTTSGIDAALQPPGRITGTVTDAATGSPVANECVGVFLGGYPFSSAVTDAAGRYTIVGLDTGSYKVEFQACSADSGYVTQFYKDKPTLATADTVAVTAGSTTPGVDAVLQTGGQITGTVTDAVTHAPISGACVGVYDTSGNLLTYARTNAAGGYTLARLQAGSYKVGFASGGTLCSVGPGNYQPQLYDDKSSFAAADLVAVTAGQTTAGIDAALRPADTPPNPPAAPTSNQAVNNSGSQTVSWAAVIDPDGDSISHYVLQHERSDQTGFSDVATVSATSYRFGTDGPPEGEGTWRYRVVAVDSQGTPSTPSDASAPVVVDKTKPNPPKGRTAPAAGYTDSATGDRWYRDSVTVSFSANGDPVLSDGSPGSGVASVTADGTFGSSNVDPATGAFSLAGTATDKAGNVSDATTVAGNVDWRAPAASFSDCPTSPVLLHATRSAHWTATDPAPSSGLATPAGGSVALDTSTAGAHTVLSPAPADHVGHTGVGASCTYRVDYAFSGFSDPVKNPPAINAMRAGRTVPLKWRLTDANGTHITALSAVTSITYKPTSCSAFTSDATGGLTADSAGGAGLRYDPAENQYVYSWKTPRAGCYTLFLTLDSGRVWPAYFHLS